MSIEPIDTPPETETATTPDLFHRVTNWISYNRGLFAAILIALPTVGLASCQSTTTSPITGQKATHGDLDKQEIDAVAGLVSAEEAEAAAYQADAAKVTAAAALAVSTAQKDAELKLAELAGKFNASKAARAATAKAMTAQFEAAHAAIEEKDQFKASLVEKIKPYTSMLPGGFGDAALVALGLIAGGAVYDNKRKNAVIADLKAKPVVS